MNHQAAKEMRGLILLVLKEQFPDYVSDRLITMTINKTQKGEASALIRSHLNYLAGEEKKYVELQEWNELGVQRTMAKLTPRGWDLLEGNIADDPGVMVIRG